MATRVAGTVNSLLVVDGTATITGGTLAGAGTVTAGTGLWSGGTMSGSGTTIINNALTISGPAQGSVIASFSSLR